MDNAKPSGRQRRTWAHCWELILILILHQHIDDRGAPTVFHDACAVSLPGEGPAYSGAAATRVITATL